MFSSLRALRHPAYRRVWLGALISNVGTWMESIAVGIYVTQTTGKAAWNGAVAALMWMPFALFAPLGGALGDRLDRRRYLAGVTLAQAAVAATLAALAFAGQLSVGWVAALVLLTGIGSALYAPPLTALFADLVPAEDLLSALSLGSAQYNVARVVGPSLAAAVIAGFGARWAFALNALSFAAVLWALRAVPTSPPGEARPLWGSIAGGAGQLWADPVVRALVLLTLALALLVAPFIGLVPAYALNVLGQGPAGTSLLVACQGLGAVTGAVALGPLAERLGRRQTLLGAAALAGPVAALYWLAPRYGLAAAGLYLLGGVYLGTLTSVSAVYQLRAPRALRGRVAAFNSVVLNGGYAVGVVSLGWLGDRLGLRVVMATAALAYTAVALGLRWRWADRYARLDELPAELSAPGGRPAPEGEALPG